MTQSPPFPWPWRGAENRRLTRIVLLWVFALNLWALFAVDILPITRRSPWDPQANLRAPLFARYDSGWYDSIVRYGYQKPPAPGKESEHAFFPLYPMLGRFVHLATGVDSFQTALLVSYLCLLTAVPLLAEEARERLGPDKGEAPLKFLFLYPVAFFLAAVYTESTYLLVALLAFRSVRHRQLWLAALLAFLAGLSRAPAAALGPGLGLAWILTHRDDRKRFPSGALLAALPLAGVFSWVYGIGFAKGEPGLFFRSMGAWRHTAGNPFDGIAAFAMEPIWGIQTGWFREHPGALLPYCHFLLLVVLGVYQITKRRWPDAAWTFSALALPMMTGTSVGIPRYTLTVYPIFFAAVEISEARPWLGKLWLAVSAAILLANSAFFVNWHFVS